MLQECGDDRAATEGYVAGTLAAMTVQLSLHPNWRIPCSTEGCDKFAQYQVCDDEYSCLDHL